MQTAAAIRNTRSGFWNLLARENKVWWHTSRWLLQALVGVIGLGGFLAFTLFALPAMVQATGEQIDVLEAGVQIFFGLGTLAFAIDVIILTQDTIIGEKQSGTAEWVLSKPVSRPAYILAKLLANALGIFATLIVLPGAAAYALFTLATGEPFPPLPFLCALGAMALHTLFYLALSLMMGVLADSRGTFLAVTLGSALGGMLLVDFIGRAAFVTPWLLNNLAVAVAQGAALPTLMLLPIAATALLTIAALAVAIWRFERAEL